MSDLGPKGERQSSAARRWRKRSRESKLESVSQGMFFSPPQEIPSGGPSAPAQSSEPAPMIDSPPDPNLTADQAAALRRIKAAYKPGEFYLKYVGILNGVLPVADRLAKPFNGSAVVVAVNGEYTVKRLRRGTDCIWPDPDNPRHPKFCVFVGEGLHGSGMGKHAIHPLR